jgi:hypothetical protein
MTRNRQPNPNPFDSFYQLKKIAAIAVGQKANERFLYFVLNGGLRLKKRKIGDIQGRNRNDADRVSPKRASDANLR